MSRPLVPRRSWFPILGAIAILWACSSTARADNAAVGRRHAQRASHLAAAGKCKQALVEYDKAIAVLRDPALLFNRGECHRKLGDVDAALADYNQFLSDLPKAPNRVEVEAHIAELKRSSGAVVPVVAAPPKVATPSGPSPAAVPAAGTAVAPPSATARHPLSGTGMATPAQVPTGGAGPWPVILPPPNDGIAGGDNSSANSLVGVPVDASSPTTEPQKSDGSLIKNPWFWVAVGAVVVGAGVATFVVLRHDNTTIPSSDLGNYRF